MTFIFSFYIISSQTKSSSEAAFMLYTSVSLFMVSRVNSDTKMKLVYFDQRNTRNLSKAGARNLFDPLHLEITAKCFNLQQERISLQLTQEFEELV